MFGNFDLPDDSTHGQIPSINNRFGYFLQILFSWSNYKAFNLLCTCTFYFSFFILFSCGCFLLVLLLLFLYYFIEFFLHCIASVITYTICKIRFFCKITTQKQPIEVYYNYSPEAPNRTTTPAIIVKMSNLSIFKLSVPIFTAKWYWLQMPPQTMLITFFFLLLIYSRQMNFLNVFVSISHVLWRNVMVILSNSSDEPNCLLRAFLYPRKA